MITSSGDIPGRNGASSMANLTISERAYQTLQELAEAEGKTPEDVLDTLLEAVIEQKADLLRRLGGVGRAKQGMLYNPATGRRIYETDDWLRHLGATEEQIRRAEQEALTDADA
jgi:hypothetical protein